MLHSQLLSVGALPTGLQQQQSVFTCAFSHGFSKDQIFGAVDHHLEFMAVPQQIRPRRSVPFWRQGDPIELAGEGIYSAGFKMQGSAAY